MNIIKKWLPRFFGCHSRKDRSFYFKGEKFPICARCTGELLGILFSCLLFYFFRTNIVINILIMFPMIIDGFIQLKTSYESTNLKRLISGFLFGYGLCNLFIESIIFMFLLGRNYGTYIK